MPRRLLLLPLLALAACATPPAPLKGNYAPLSPELAAHREAVGDLVRWGGTLVRATPEPGRTCFELVGRELDARGRPREVDRSAGRFVACRAGFYDPEVFAEGRAVTVTGRIDGFETRRVGEYDYRQPRVAADVVYLWPERREVEVIHAPYPYRYGYWWW
ncbi:Slp family lipoprotein [Coralloluteibacterium thermophilus]|uniref:Slp family lipoprotein n=1 Tax=Coralloluteibacterium thermophilum TaxID=2707049 RepID=A0ABV9NIK4_9GAMM